MTRTEVISLIVETLLITGLLLLVILAIYRPKEFFRTLFIEFPIAILKGLYYQVSDTVVLLSTPFIYLVKLFYPYNNTNKRNPFRH